MMARVPGRTHVPPEVSSIAHEISPRLRSPAFDSSFEKLHAKTIPSSCPPLISGGFVHTCPIECESGWEPPNVRLRSVNEARQHRRDHRVACHAMLSATKATDAVREIVTFLGYFRLHAYDHDPAAPQVTANETTDCHPSTTSFFAVVMILLVVVETATNDRGRHFFDDDDHLADDHAAHCDVDTSRPSRRRLLPRYLFATFWRETSTSLS